MESDNGFGLVAAVMIVCALATAGLVGYVMVRERDTGCDCEDDGGVDLCTHVSPASARALIGNGTSGVTILDVRTVEEYGEGHLSGARNLDYYADDFWSRLDTYPRDGTYVVYCEDGIRSRDTCSVMVSMEFTSVRDILGGFAAWNEQGFPVEE